MHTYAGIADCARQVLVQEGWRAFFRGIVPSMLGILPYAGVDITIFELLKEQLLDKVLPYLAPSLGGSILVHFLWILFVTRRL
jgi:hypothetical protein